jgi:hypothetical protein
VRDPVALILDAAVPVQAVRLERVQDGVGTAAQHALAVEVLDPYQPAATTLARVEEAAERRDERAEMQRPGG